MDFYAITAKGAILIHSTESATADVDRHAAEVEEASDAEITALADQGDSLADER